MKIKQTLLIVAVIGFAACSAVGQDRIFHRGIVAKTLGAGGVGDRFTYQGFNNGGYQKVGGFGYGGGNRGFKSSSYNFAPFGGAYSGGYGTFGNYGYGAFGGGGGYGFGSTGYSSVRGSVGFDGNTIYIPTVRQYQNPIDPYLLLTESKSYLRAAEASRTAAIQLSQNMIAERSAEVQRQQIPQLIGSLTVLMKQLQVTQQQSAAPRVEATNTQQLAGVLAKSCAKCHAGPGSREPSFDARNLQSISPNLRLQMIKRIRNGSMPPNEGDPLTAEDQRKVVDEILK